MRLEPFFSGGGIDRADLLRAQPERLAALAANPAARQLRWEGALPLLDANGQLQWEAVSRPDLFLGMADEGPRFSPLPVGEYDTRAQFAVLGLLAPSDAPLLAAALSLGNWHRRHSFCAICGAASQVNRGGWSRRCPACAGEHYPRVDPVVIMLAEHDDRLLLGRQPHYPPGRYSALAGFVEVGETIEAAVAREFHEEAGIAVTDVRYLCSQPWPFPSSLMIGCIATALDDRLTIDLTELDDARWFTRSEVAAALSEEPGASFVAPPVFAVARTLLDWWVHA